MASKKYVISCYGIDQDMREHLKKKLKGHKMFITSDTLCLDNINSNTEILGVFVESHVNEKILAELPKLKLIVTMSTGFDHIDVGAAKKRQIPVCNVPTYGENTVAEHAVALTLALTRKLFPAVKRVKEGVYDYHGLRGVDVKGKTIGVVGTGNIGKQYIAMLHCFQVKIIAYDAFPNEKLAEDLGFTYVTLPRLLSQSDIVSLHIPLFKETYHLINKSNIKKMKKGAYLINTARGALVDPEALLWALNTGHLAGAGLDVLEDEEMLKNMESLVYSEGKDGAIRTSLMNNVLIDHPQTIVTPHNAFNSVEAIQRIVDTTVQNIQAFASGNIQNQVHAQKTS